MIARTLKIRRAKIIYPGKPLTKWYAEQTDKPDVLFNASLYEGNRPCGTIIRGGEIARNSGTGMGFGTKDGKPGIGTPWQDWDDYFTGFNCYVQSGKFSAPTWRDVYVFEQSLTRIALGKKGDEWCVITGSGVIGEKWNGKEYASPGNFANECLRGGVTELIGLDGGGSRALLWHGKWIYTSSRTPYNAVAIWTEKEEPELKVKANKKVQTYASDGVPESNRYISVGDICSIDQAFVEVEYPVASGTRKARIKLEDLLGFTKA